jgi:hypothetical protein
MPGSFEVNRELVRVGADSGEIVTPSSLEHNGDLSMLVGYEGVGSLLNVESASANVSMRAFPAWLQGPVTAFDRDYLGLQLEPLQPNDYLNFWSEVDEVAVPSSEPEPVPMESWLNAGS